MNVSVMEAKEESGMLIIKVEVAIEGWLPEGRRETDAKPSSITQQQQHVGEEDMLDDGEEGQVLFRVVCYFCVVLNVTIKFVTRHQSPGIIRNWSSSILRLLVLLT